MTPWTLDPMHMSQYSVVSIGETRVLFDGVAAPIVYALDGRICVIVPFQVAGKTSTAVVVEYEGQRSPAVVLPVVRSSPALFTLDASGSGQAAMLNETGCCNSVRNPAVRGTIATLYATGEGQPLPGAARRGVTPLPVRVTIGGVPAPILWTGNLGLLQVNFRVPQKAPVGDAVPMVLTVGNARSRAPVTMAIRSEKQQILVVSEDAAIRRRLSAMLTAAGYDLFTASEVTQATRLGQDRNVDLLIADLSLPPLDRAELAQAIREAHPQVKMLAISAALNAETVKTADLLGAQAVVARPLSAQTLMARVRALLQRRPAVY
jgi:uncharacterized protein (TIGR03437 family)